MKPFSIAELKERAAAAQKLWEESTNEQRRLLVAKDVIARMESKQFFAGHSWGTMNCDLPRGKDSFPPQYNPDVQLAILNENECSCCALGAMLMSSIGFANKVVLKSLSSTFHGEVVPSRVTDGLCPASDRLHEVFETSQLRLIEWTYERGKGAVGLSGASAIRAALDTYKTLEIDPPRSIPSTIGLVANAEQANYMHNGDNDLRFEFNPAALWRAMRFAYQYPDDDKRLVAIMENIVENGGEFNPWPT